MTAMDDSRALLRHALATVAYRGGKAVRGAPESFAGFRAAAGPRTPLEILAHLGDLFDWALSMATGTPDWKGATPQSWEREVDRFFDALGRFDAYLSLETPLAASPEKLFQGPVADALTHVGQLTLLRRLAGAPIRGENYVAAEISAGRVGPDQPSPRREFD
jgi:hypothetical protein